MSEASSTTRVVVADDHPLYLDSLARIIQSHPGFELIGAARDGYEALAVIEAECPDVAIIDMQMPGLDGPEVVARTRSLGSSTAAILITGYADPEALYAAISYGAEGVLSKGSSVESIISAIELVVAGEAVLSGAAQTAVVLGIRARSQERKPCLTERERQVLALAAEGLVNKQIAEQLCLGVETVKTHLRSSYEKLNVSRRAAAVSAAIGRGLLPLRTPPS
jgi:two-component system nitrate/nitrite response regulator NarL